MKRFFFAMLAFIAIMIAGPGLTPASAQCPQTCTYHVSVSCLIPPGCFPLQLTTGWHCLNPIDVLTVPINSCGEFDLPKVGPCEPVPCNLLWASLNGGATIVVPNGMPVDFACADGSPLCLRLIQTPDGCSRITIDPGPCPISR
jgi:hypothetical protein